MEYGRDTKHLPMQAGQLHMAHGGICQQVQEVLLFDEVAKYWSLN